MRTRKPGRARTSNSHLLSAHDAGTAGGEDGKMPQGLVSRFGFAGYQASLSVGLKGLDPVLFADEPLQSPDAHGSIDRPPATTILTRSCTNPPAYRGKGVRRACCQI